MATTRQFNKDDAFGKIAEIAVKKLLESRGHAVCDISKNFTAGDLLIDGNIVLEVKHQRIISRNKLFIELFNPDFDYGWFFKDEKVNCYCFYLNDLFIFIDRNDLHNYFITKFPEVFSEDYNYKKDKFGFAYEIIDLNDLINYFEKNRLHLQIIDNRKELF